MPGYHPEFEPDFEEDRDQQPQEKPKPKAHASVTTTPIGEKGIAQVGESGDCEDGGILRV